MNSNKVWLQRISRARQGEQDAFTELVREWEPALLRIVRRRLGHSLPAVVDPEDVVQEVWILFVNRLLPDSRLDTPPKLFGYLRVTAQNKAREWRRHFFRPTRNLRRAEPLGGRQFVDPKPWDSEGRTAEEHAFAKDQCGLVNTADPLARDVGWLLAFGLTLGEAAAHLRTSGKTVRRPFHRLLQRLR
jgi:DNA-directed RNA polymerase specialized sigma24 family protein